MSTIEAHRNIEVGTLSWLATASWMAEINRRPVLLPYLCVKVDVDVLKSMDVMTVPAGATEPGAQPKSATAVPPVDDAGATIEPVEDEDEDDEEDGMWTAGQFLSQR